MATIRRRSSTWQAQIRRQDAQPISRSFSTKAEAIIWARDLERSIDRADPPADSKALQSVRLVDLITRYETEITGKKRGANQERYKLRVIRAHAISNLPLSKLSPSAVCGFRDDRLRKVCASTVRRELALLQHCLEVSRREWGMPIRTNPVHIINLPGPSKARDKRLEEGDSTKLQAAIGIAHAWYLRPLIELAIETGMRRGELLSLLWADVSLTKRIAYLPKTKNGHARTVPLTSKAVAALRNLPRTDSRVFPVNGNAVRLAWERLRKWAGLRDLRFHDLRHEAVTLPPVCPRS
jgi:integrase